MKTIIDFLHFDYPTKEQKTVLNAIQKFTENDNTNDFIIMQRVQVLVKPLSFRRL